MLGRNDRPDWGDAMQAKDDPPIGLDKMGEPIIDPAPDKPPTWEDSRSGKALFKGMKWGAAAGLALAQIYISSHSVQTVFGSIYVGEAIVPVLLGTALGAAVGAAFGWLSANVKIEDDLPPR